MMYKLSKLTSFFLFTMLMISCSPKPTADYQVIPLPQNINAKSGKKFLLDDKTTIVFAKDNAMMQKNAAFLAKYIEAATGQTLKLEAGDPTPGSISLQLGLVAENPEAYELSADGDKIVITGASEAGVFYGIQTLRKSINPSLSSQKIEIEFPEVEISDYPRFSYRGVHLDVARHFFSVEEVKTYIDMMALHNMNRLHWHITEDQGWRIEIKKYPKLTEIGSKRKETVIGQNSGKYDGKPYGGFYTQEEAKEIVRYAAEQYITVIPEIDLPGHMQAALAAYPELGCTGGPYEVWTMWGVSDNVLCVGTDETFKFLDDVMSEIIDIFPSEYIHVGGDECPKTKWEQCPKCQAKIKSLGIKSDSKHTKEEYLQSYVINHVEKYLNSRGRQIIGWDEILEGGLSPNATIMSWRGEEGGIEAARQKHDVIMTPNSYLYFDYYQTKDLENEPFAIGGYVPLELVYSYEPYSKELTKEEQQYIIGVQANHWTEYMPTFSHVQYMALPRWAALAEVQWSNPADKNYDNFLTRLPRLIDWYKLEGYNYAKHVFDVNPRYESNPNDKTVDVFLSTLNDAPIYYTLDGTEPSESSPVFKDILKISETCTLKAAAIRPNEGKSRTMKEDITFSKSTLKPIVSNQKINTRHEYGGVNMLVDGLKGSANFADGRWIGYSGNDMEVVIDLEEPTEISQVELSTCVRKWDWIFDIRALSLWVSDNGEDFTMVASEDYPALKQDDKNGIYNHKLEFSPVKAKYVKVIALSERKIPDWHDGKGKSAFIFVDEVLVD